jgi:hypothetical protein
MRAAADELELKIAQLDTLMTLDVPANAVLTRTGARPTSDDVIARFNYETVAALLANAPLVRVSLGRAPSNAEAIRAFCAEAGVSAEMAGRELVLHGRQDAMNGWARNGGRLVRALSLLLCAGLPARSGEALVAAPGGGEWRFRLDADALADLGAPRTATVPLFSLDEALSAWRHMDATTAAFAALRRAGGADGWILRRASEPLVLAGGVLPALFTAVRGPARVPLILAPSSPAGMDRLAAGTTRIPVVAFAVRASEAATSASAVPSLSFARRDDVAALPALLAQAIGDAEERSDRDRLEALMDEAREAGVLSESQLAQRLGCAEEDVWALLALPAAQHASAASGLRYIEGFGLCTSGVLERAQAAAADVRTQPTEEPMRAVRMLGRRLREVTGASEGIECLIAYLEAA